LQAKIKNLFGLLLFGFGCKFCALGAGFLDDETAKQLQEIVRELEKANGERVRAS
jgi:predicted amino acid racemase